MASGSFNIDTFSYRRQLPLSNEYTAFSTGTMFAVGPSSFLQGYSFYDYSYGLLGFPDTSTLSVSLTRLVCTSVSTVYGNEVGLQRFVSSAIQLNQPFSYSLSPVSTALIEQSAGAIPYPVVIDGPRIELSNAFSQAYNILDSFNYNVQVDVNYSIVLNKPDTTYNWISTICVFNEYDEFVNQGRTLTTRVGTNCNYTTINNRFWFYSQDQNGTSLQNDPLNIPDNPSTLQLKIVLQNTGGSNFNPGYSVYIPGDYNYQLTFWPTSSNYSNAPPPLNPIFPIT